MNNVQTVSEITYQDVAEYLRLDELSSSDINTLNSFIKSSVSFVSQYTGRTTEELDNYPEFIPVILVLCQDMWDNRTLYVDKTNLNKLVEDTLGMHSVNLL